MDWAELHRFGLYDPAAPGADDRRALLEWLVERGCTVDEMVAAHARGRLFALAGDRLIRPGRDRLTLLDVAERVGADLDRVRRYWRACGLPDAAVGAAVASEDDVDAIRIMLAFSDSVGEDAMLGIARVLGASVARVADAESALARRQSDLSLDRTGNELVTAQAYAAVAMVVPRVERVMSVLHRHHLESVRRHFEGSDSADIVETGAIRHGVGFADLSGFTGLSESLPLNELSAVVTRFEDAASGIVNAGGGRVVKFIGDAVMFVAPQPAVAANIASWLVEELGGAGGLPVRVGVTYGELLSLDGDYFGPDVNLASRLVTLAEPGRVLASQRLAEQLDPAVFLLDAQEPLAVRGFAEPVAAYALSRRVAASEAGG